MKPQIQKELTERDVKDLLTPRGRPVPPVDLAERIKREIPAELPPIPALAKDARPVVTNLLRSRAWLMAASVVLAVGSGFLALRWMDRMTPGDTVTMAVKTDAAEGAAVKTVTGDTAAGAATEDAAAAARPAAGGERAAGSLPETGAGEAPAAAIALPARPAAEAADDASSSRGASARLEADFDQADAQRRISRQPIEPRPEETRAQRSGKLEQGLGVEEPETIEEEIVVVAEAPVMTTSSASTFQAPEPSPPAAVAPPPPRPASPARRPPPPPPARPASPAPQKAERPDSAREAASRDQLRALGYVEESRQNLRVERENTQIRRMEAEARALERELKALEAGRPAAEPPPSTGGTAEPNDAPYGDVFFESAGTNPFIDTEDDAQSTFGLDVDTGSYTVIRRYLRDGHLPPPDAVRVEELVNYFDYGDAPPESREFAIHAEGAPSIYGEGERYYLLRFNLSGRELAERERRPALLTFVVDVSGSMSRENRLGLVKQALALLIDQLRADDRLALVIYGSRGQVVLEPTGDHGAIRRAIDRLHTQGSTNAEEGLTLAYELAARHRRRGAINRVILCSDGVANVGATSSGSILDRIRGHAEQGIELTTVGFGMGNYNDVLMERLADTGNGRYAYVDTLDEARRIFVENLTGTLQTLAADARAQVEFDPQTVSRYRLLGYENRDIADASFRDMSVDAGEIGVGHKVTALYEIKTEGKLRGRDRVATLRLRYGAVDSGKVVDLERTVTGADFAGRWEGASPALKLTSLVAEYAEILKRSYWAREGDLDDVFRRAQRLSAQFEGDREVADFVSLVGRAAEAWERQDR